MTNGSTDDYPRCGFCGKTLFFLDGRYRCPEESSHGWHRETIERKGFPKNPEQAEGDAPPEVRVHLDAATLDAADKAVEPEDPRVELLAEELEAASGCCFDSWPCSEADRWYRDARLILARLDAVRADA